jgi:hypothetical protein
MRSCPVSSAPSSATGPANFGAARPALRPPRARRWLAGALLAPALLGWPGAQAQLTWGDVRGYEPPAEVATYARDRLARAGADECYDGISVDYPPFNPDGSCSAGIPKANQGYVWGLAQAGAGDAGFAGDDLWFGSIANPLCTAPGGIFLPEPVDNGSWVCEYGQSMLARRPVAPLPPSAGDWRVPRAYSYNTRTRKLTDRTPLDRNYLSLVGLRSAGALGDMVFLAGPNFVSDIVFAAWDASTGAYRGSCRATALRNIRQWITVNGVLYAGAGRRAGDGVILRWRGTVAQPFAGAASPSDYCGFEVVGVLPDLPAYLADYNGQRLAASVWSDSQRESDAAAPGGLFSAGVYLGPAYGADGQYTAQDAQARWRRIWTPAQYETDPVVAAVTAGGAIAFWKGWLWFGTIHNTIGTYQAHSVCTLPACYGLPATPAQGIDLLFNITRAASIWRARLDAQGRPEVELLYGETELPALVPGTRSFEARATGWTPRFGRAGLGNPFLNYAWAASAGEDDLLFGFYDDRYVFDVRLGVASNGDDPARGYGADLWRFSDPEAPAQPESTGGLGNFANFGVRTMLRLDGSGDVILGSANALNLEPEGGWELFRLTPPARAVAAPAPVSPAAPASPPRRWPR